MMKLKLVAENPDSETSQEMVIGERSWRPARSFMAIANQKVLEKKGRAAVWSDNLEDIDDNTGQGIGDNACTCLAEEMEEMMKDPFAAVDYGMSVEMDENGMVYTFPNTMCTAYFEDADTGEFYESLDSPGILGKRVRSWFRTSETEMKEFIAFLKGCGGFQMP